MTNAEAIKIAQGLITDFKCESETMVEFCNTIIKALSAEPQEWISVKEHGKPKKSGKYWVTIQSTTSDVKWVRANEYHAERDFFDTEMAWKNAGIKITAWQPIIEPSPYKGE